MLIVFWKFQFHFQVQDVPRSKTRRNNLQQMSLITSFPGSFKREQPGGLVHEAGWKSLQIISNHILETWAEVTP